MQAAEAGQRFRVWPAVRYLMCMRTFWLLTLAVGAPGPLGFIASKCRMGCHGMWDLYLFLRRCEQASGAYLVNTVTLHSHSRRWWLTVC